MENSNLYINNEGELCYNETTIKETLYVKSIFENIFGTIFNVSLEKIHKN
jgi:hypothetical protein